LRKKKMLRKYLGLIVTAGALAAPAIAEEPADIDDGKMLLTAAQMDRVTAGGFADALANVTSDMIAVVAAGEGDKSSSSTASATLNVTYTITPEGEYIASFETDYEGTAEADSQQASVQQNAPVPGVPDDDAPAPVEPEPEPDVLTQAQQLLQDRGLQGSRSATSIAKLISDIQAAYTGTLN
jgi:hypothetical protein